MGASVRPTTASSTRSARCAALRFELARNTDGVAREVSSFSPEAIHGWKTEIPTTTLTPTRVTQLQWRESTTRESKHSPVALARTCLCRHHQGATQCRKESRRPTCRTNSATLRSARISIVTRWLVTPITADASVGHRHQPPSCRASWHSCWKPIPI